MPKSTTRLSNKKQTKKLIKTIGEFLFGKPQKKKPKKF